VVQLEVWDQQEQQGIKDPRQPQGPQGYRAHQDHQDHQEYQQQHLLFYTALHQENPGQQELLCQTQVDQMEVWDQQEQQGIKEPRELWALPEHQAHLILQEYRQRHLLYYTVLHLESLGRQEYQHLHPLRLVLRSVHRVRRGR